MNWVITWIRQSSSILQVYGYCVNFCIWLEDIHNNQFFSDSKVCVTNMVPTWVLSPPDGPHVGPINHASWVTYWATNLIVTFMASGGLSLPIKIHLSYFEHSSHVKISCKVLYKDHRPSFETVSSFQWCLFIKYGVSNYDNIGRLSCTC